MDFEIILEDLHASPVENCSQNLPRLILKNLIFTPVSAVVSTGILRQGCFNGF